MHQHIRITTLVVGVLLSVGCGEDPAAAPPLPQVTERDGLLLDLDMERLLVAIGDSSTVTIRLSNVNAAPVRIEFGSTCEIMPYIETTAGAVRVPGGGSWSCGAAITSGTYRAYALLETPVRGSRLRSRTIEFEVR